MMTKVPLYQSIRALVSEDRDGIGHAGLWFNKFFAGYLPDAQSQVDENREAWKASRLAKFAQHSAGDPHAIAEAMRRQADMVERLGGTVFRFRNATEFVTGLGNAHPVENGFAWHHSLGTPYLPGSGVKGVIRSMLIETWNESTPDDAVSKKRQQLDEWLGTPDHVGQFIMLDLLPTSTVQLRVEIMTPHYSDYQNGKSFPGDWISPNPIPFLVAAAGQSWQLGVVCRDPNKTIARELMEILTEAFAWGVGAKTSIGYGSMLRDEAGEQTAMRQRQAKRQQENDARKKAAELDSMPEDLRELLKRAEDENWTKEVKFFAAGCAKYLDEVAKPNSDCLAWICDLCLPAINSNYRGAWEDPDKVKGKRKQNVYPDSLRPILTRLKELRKAK